eukprot:427853_1
MNYLLRAQRSTLRICRPTGRALQRWRMQRLSMTTAAAAAQTAAPAPSTPLKSLSPLSQRVTASDLIDTHAECLLSVSRQESIYDATRVMNANDIGSVVITDTWQRVVGIMTERDYIMKSVAKALDPRLYPASSIMTPNPRCVSSRNTLDEVVAVMIDHECRHVPVLGELAPDTQEKGSPPHSKALVGVISIRGVIQKLHDVAVSVDVRTWSVDKVCAWVRSLGPIYGDYSDAFQSNQVTGALLLDVVDGDTVGDLVPNRLHQRVVLNAIDISEGRQPMIRAVTPPFRQSLPNVASVAARKCPSTPWSPPHRWRKRSAGWLPLGVRRCLFAKWRGACAES